MVDMKLGLQQRQDLKMTAELRQAIEMLQLSSLEMQEMLRRELADNPCLEVTGHDGAADETPVNTNDHAEGDWDSHNETAWDDGTRESDRWSIVDVGQDGPMGGSGGGGRLGEDGHGDWQDSASHEASLQDHLTTQFDQMVQSPVLRLIGRYLIDALDESGYLRVTVAEVALRLKVSEDTVDDARALLTLLEPAGIGARDLPECLRLQLHARGKLDAAAEACLAHLDKVAGRDWQGLAKLAKVPVEEVLDAVEAIRACNPKPGLAYGGSRVEGVVPDVLVTTDAHGAWQVQLNGAAFPKLLALPMELPALRGPGADQAKKYAQENYGKAKWLIGALEQRATNILKVAKEIVRVQQPFFDAGAEFLVPLTMRQVAEKVGVHESTVSRVARGKFLQAPMGVFEFTHFFASGVGSTGGNVAVAATSVQTMISRLVQAEDPKKPLSDEQIVARLKTEGVEVARRTVAKYRGILNIPGTAERRVRS